MLQLNEIQPNKENEEIDNTIDFQLVDFRTVKTELNTDDLWLSNYNR